MKSKELLLKHLNLNDCKGYVTSDGRLYKAIINALEEAINYTQCCEELKYKEVIPFEEWLSHFKKEDNRYWLNKHTQYCKEAMKMHYNTLPNE